MFTRAIGEHLISPKDAAVVASLHWHPKVTAFVSADSDMKRAAQLRLLPDWVQGYKEEYR